jgi:hypothetical protein
VTGGEFPRNDQRGVLGFMGIEIPEQLAAGMDTLAYVLRWKRSAKRMPSRVMIMSSTIRYIVAS